MLSWLTMTLIYLIAAAIAVPLSVRAGFGAVLGYLLAGIVIGPCLGMVGQETQSIQQIAEFGVVVMMFLVGLELEPARIWRLRHQLIGLGGLQVILCTALMVCVAVLAGWSWQTGLVVASVLSLSSTAIVLQTLGEKRLLTTPGGQASFSVLLFQDIAAIPLMAVLPLLSITSADHPVMASAVSAHLSGWMKMGTIVAVVVLIAGGGRYLARPALRYIAQSRLPEVFTVFTLTLVVGIAVLMSAVGLSPALGTFLAGVVLADSEYRHALESNLEPFRGLLLGLFFITVGAGVNFHVFLSSPLVIVGVTLAFMTLKIFMLLLLGWGFRLRGADMLLFAFGLSQAGEFGFVLLAFSQQIGVLPAVIAEKVLLGVTLSMLLTPLLFIVYERLLVPRLSQRNQRENDVVNERNPVIIVGHGRMGQHINSLLLACGYQTTVIDADPEMVAGMSAYGIKTWFGDARQPEMLESAGLHEARLLVVAIDDPQAALQITQYSRHRYPDLKIVARTYDRRSHYHLQQAGADIVIRETFDGAVRAGREALELLGIRKGMAEAVSDLYRQRDLYRLDKITEIYDPTIPFMRNSALVSLSQAMDSETANLIQRLLDENPAERTADKAVMSATTQSEFAE